MKELIAKFIKINQGQGFLAALRATRYWIETRGVGQRIEKFRFAERGSVREDIIKKYNYEGVLLDFFVENKENAVHKWHHYIPLYDQYFSRFRSNGDPVRFLEIGVSKGGSLQVWRRYFGPNAIIFGIDIDPVCEKYDGLAGNVRIGSQGDPQFLRSVIDEMGGVDIVLDDGSHRMEHISSSLRNIFPHLSLGGLYLIEDLHTAYWSSYGGGYKSEHNFFNDIRKIIDDMHHWYHDEDGRYEEVSRFCSAIHIHDSIVVLEKKTVFEPTHSQIL